MDFSLTEEQAIFKTGLKKFLAQEVAPLVAEAEKTERFPKQLFRRFAELGYLGITYPEELGGSNLGYQTLLILAEELGRVCSGFAGSILAHMSIATTPIFMAGTEEQKKRWVKPAIRGEKIAAFGLTEPNAGSDAAALRTRAAKTKGGYILNGSKIFITNGPIADFATVFATLDPAKGHKGIAIFVVERGMKGFTQGKPMEKLGNRSSETGELVFEDCFVPEENLIGPEGGSFNTVMEALNSGRMCVGARAVGIAEAAFQAALEYSRQRVAFGKPIFQFQLTQSKLARMKMEIEASRLLCWHAAWLKDQGKPNAQEASFGKLKATETAVWVTGEAVQILGGYGYTPEYPVERYFRDAKSMTIVEGTSEIQQIIIAKRL